MSIKILVVTGLYPPDIGGPATYTKMLEQHLPQHGFTLRIAQYGWVRQYPKLFRHIVFGWKVYRQSADCDIVYALDPVSVGLPTVIALFFRKKRFILRVPGDYAWEQGQLRFGVTDRLHTFIEKRYSYGIRTSILCWLESYVAKKASHVIVPSEYMQGVVNKWGVAKKNIHTIHSALFPIDVPASRESIRTQLGYKGITLVSAGRLVPNKGFDTLLHAFAELRHTHQDLELVIMGDGPQRAHLESVAADLSISRAVRFTGSLSKDTLGAAIKAADIFVLNTAHEGFSHQLLEVMDLGIPIITTEVGGNPELIKHETNGLLIPYDDKMALVYSIRRLVLDTELRHQLADQARLRVSDFEKRHMVSALAKLLKEMNKK